MTKVVGNPYIAGPPIAGDVGFYGREDIFHFVRDTFSSPAQNVIVLYGLRRIGKTSILYQLQKPSNLPPSFHPVYLDLQGLAEWHLDEVLYRLAQEIAKSLNIPTPAQSEFRIGDGDYFYDQFLPRVYESLKGDRLLLLFDEFEVLSAEPRNDVAIQTFFPYLQKKILREQQLAFIFAVGRRLDELSNPLQSTFKAARTKFVSFLREEEARRLIIGLASGVVEYDEKTIEQIISLTACHPYLTQLLCYELVDYLTERDKTHATADDVDAVIDNAIESGSAALAWLWDGLPRAERFFLSAVAHVTDEGGMATQDGVRDILHQYRVQLLGPELTRAPDTLITKWGWLKPTKEGYKFVVELLRRWIIKEHSLEEAKRELELVSPRASLLYEAARRAHLDNELDIAIRHYKDALAVNPYHTGAQLGLAQVLFEQGKVTEAITEYEKAHSFDEASARDGLVEARLALAESLEREGEIVRAIREYENFILPIAPDDENVQERAASIWLRQGDEHLQEGHFDEAAQAYDRAEEIQSGKKEVLNQKRYQLEMAIGYASAMRAHKAKEWAVAEAEWSKLYSKDRDYRDRDGKDKPVAVLLAEAIERREVKARLTLAESLEREGETSQAIQEYDKILAIAPDDEDVQEQTANFWIRQGDKYRREGRYEKALEAYRRAREIQPAKKETIDRNWREAMAAGYAGAMQAHRTEDWTVAEEKWSKLYGEDRDYDKDGENKKVAVQLAEAIEKREAVPRPEQRYLRLASGMIVALLALSLCLGAYVVYVVPSTAPPSATPVAIATVNPTTTDTVTTAITMVVTVVVTVTPEPPTPIPTPVEEPTPTPTPMPIPTTTTPPTPTPTPPTDTPTPSPPSPPPTDTPMPTATPTPSLRTEVWDVDINSQNSEILYAVVKGEGVYKTMDGGGSWGQVLSQSNITSLTIDPSNPSTLYVAARNGVMRSTDSGTTWALIAIVKVNLPEPAHVLAVAPGDSQIVYAGTDGGVYRSPDGGRTWEARNRRMGDTAIYSLVIGSDDGQLVYAAGKGAEIWKSKDGGSSPWESLSSDYFREGIYALALHPDNSQVIYAGTDRSLLMSTDGGRGWLLRDGGLKNPQIELKISALAIDPRDPDTIYAGTGFRSNYDGHGIYKSTDGGLSWKPINNGLPIDDMYLGGYYVQAIAIDPHDSQTIYAGGFSGLYKSTDGGASWNQK